MFGSPLEEDPKEYDMDKISDKRKHVFSESAAVHFKQLLRLQKRLYLQNWSKYRRKRLALTGKSKQMRH